MKHWTAAVLLCALALLPVGVLAEGGQPTVQIVSPAAGLTLSEDSVGVQVRVAAAAPAKIASVELSVDGFLHSTRAISPAVAAGTCTLQWDTPQFANGEHVLTVKAKDTAGKEASVQLRVILARPELGGDALPRVVIERPRGGQQVSGVTKVDVKASHPSGIKYVMIFVDDLFAFMANRPPFSYDWDTRRVADGLHTLVARAQAATDAEANSSPVQVAVANTSEVKPEPAPGGIREVVMADVRPATTRAQPAPPTTTKAPSAPASAGWRSEPAASVASADWRTAAPAHVGAISQTSVPSPVIALASAAPQGRPSPALKGTVAHHETRAASGGPVSVGTGASAASGSLSTPKTVAARPGPAVPGVAKPRADAGVAVALAPVGRVQPMGPAIRTLPMATAAKPVRAVGFAPVVGGQPEIRPQMPEVKVPRAAPRPVPERKEPAIAAPRALEPRPAVEKPSGAIRLYYNGVPMQTDVEPVITAGISAGPFRHIMEHSGGQVSWHPDKQTVTASALAKDVTLTIGSRKAIVNDSVLMMDLAAFLEKGRAMVPLRFFRDAFDFTVEYDAATGRICIQR